MSSNSIQYVQAIFYQETLQQLKTLFDFYIDARFLLLHENRSEDAIKNFFNEVYELFVKVVMNPFYDSNQKIQLSSFEERVKSAARKYL
ncbi:trapp complex subunit trs20 [Stylonychia lemnae]|uniref:Trapp complex subunit trs20 n=1 Tax=Stylonychia lemnae TaxID=5949 RepID=A0A078B7C9_STYLE|nr:trapp complex subunit trs20 [Stylonychia lemnae]|eukprot:CDW90319.1 trapp complex subunit trs20 [Stylonychia lemnae]